MSETPLHALQPTINLADRAADDLRQAIRQGNLDTEGRLPSEPELSRRLGISRVTLRQALSILEQEGLLTRRQGMGTFVVQETRQLQNNLNQNFGVTDLIESAGWEAGLVWQSIDYQPADRPTAAQLGLPPKSRVMRIERTRTANRKPFAFTVDIVPMRVFASRNLDQPSTTARLEAEQSLYHLLDQLGITIHHGIATIRPVQLDQQIAAHLNRPAGSLALLLEQIDYTNDGEKVVFSQEYHPDDVFRVYRKGPGPRG
jgi:GntR family transcriptional regulator